MATLSSAARAFSPARDYVPPAVDARSRPVETARLKVSPVVLIAGCAAMVAPLWHVIGRAMEAQAATTLHRTRVQIDLAVARNEALRAEIQELRRRERVALWARGQGMVPGQDTEPYVCGLTVSLAQPEVER